MKIARTNKQFTKDNLSLDFLRKTLAIAGHHKAPLLFEMEDFIVTEEFRGQHDETGHKTPWEDGDEKKGYTKEHFLTRIEHNKGFDTFAYIFTGNARLSGYFKNSLERQYSPDQLEWVNLLLEYGFLQIEIN